MRSPVGIFTCQPPQPEALPLRLLLLRHAKSSWEHPGLSDHDRPLSDRGRRAARAMARTLAAEGLHLDAVLTSSALRARTTCENVLAPLGPEPEVTVELYMASPREMLELVREQGPDVSRLAVVGHNPGMHDFAVRLCGDGPPTELRRLREKFPTGALAEIDLPGRSWREVGFGTGTLVRFLRPKDLEDAEELGL